MSTHVCSVTWARRDGEAFVDGRFGRRHEWRFDGGAVVAASASPHIVPAPYSVAELLDPEEAFVAALASCHMLFFLHLAAMRQWRVDTYDDQAVGTLTGTAMPDRWMSVVRLQPLVTFAVSVPDLEEIREVHEEADSLCFLARSVRTEIVIDLERQKLP